MGYKYDMKEGEWYDYGVLHKMRAYHAISRVDDICSLEPFIKANICGCENKTKGELLMKEENNGWQYEYFKVPVPIGTTLVGGSVYTVCKNAGLRPVCWGGKSYTAYNNETFCQMSPMLSDNNN